MQIEKGDVIISDCNLFCTANNILLGDNNAQDAPLDADGTGYFDKINLADLFAKNATALNTGYLIILGNMEVGNGI